MNVTRLKRLAVSGMATGAMAAGALTLAPAPAEAATAATYTCTSNLPLPAPLSGVLPTSFQVPATITASNLPSVVTSNLPVPAGIPVVGTFDFSASGLAGILQGLGITLQTTLNTVTGNVPGAGAIPLSGAFSQINGGFSTLSAQLGSFTPTGSGALPIPVPTSFDFGLVAPVFGLLGYKCTLNNPAGTAPIGTINVVKQSAKVKAHAKAKPGHKALVTVKVKTSAGQKAAGSVVAKLRGMKAKTKVLSNGKVRFVFKHLKLGKNKIKISFLGNSYTDAAKKKVTVRIAR